MTIINFYDIHREGDVPVVRINEEIIKAAQTLLKQVKPEESAAGKYKVEF